MKNNTYFKIRFQIMGYRKNWKQQDKKKVKTRAKYSKLRLGVDKNRKNK